ncbi:MAG TPA: sulfite exporter TauE/SafE family protein [Candidatus Angelobacter sp.]|nr:sulfite exporter TauE/SafE family protein [Candidatus Angelobacter sp.]
MTWLYLLLGLIVGLISGVVGTGGGVLIVPALVFLFHMNQRTAQGTSLGALLAPIGILAFWEYHKAGAVNVSAALWIAVGFAVGGYFGGMWAQHLSEPILRRGLGTLLVLSGLRMLLVRN